MESIFLVSPRGFLYIREKAQLHDYIEISDLPAPRMDMASCSRAVLNSSEMAAQNHSFLSRQHLRTCPPNNPVCACICTLCEQAIRRAQERNSWARGIGCRYEAL
jgi:hypothetical protein